VIDIPAPGDGSRVEVVRKGFGCGPDAMTAVQTFPDAVTLEPLKQLVFEAGTHTGYQLNSKGTVLRKMVVRPRAARHGGASVRATPPGQSGRWFYIAEGPYAGWWFKDTRTINAAP
jgi:hypothetical protein